MQRIQTLSRISRWVLAAATVLAGLCLIAGCLMIYHSGGEQLYTPEKVAQTVAAFAVPIWLWAVLTVFAAALHIVCPRNRKQAFESQPEMTLQRLECRVDLSLCSQEFRTEVTALRIARRKDAMIGLGLLLICSVLFLIYGTNPENFHSSQINGSMVKAVSLLLACMAVPFCWSLFAARRIRRSALREAELLKAAPKEARVTPPAPKKQLWILPLRVILLCAALGLILYGFFADGTADVLTKAVNICTECVGLG